MQSAREIKLLHLIYQDWQILDDTNRPWGIWVRAYNDIEEDEIPFKLLPQRTWFLDRYGIHQHSVWSWERFRVVQIDQSWCQRGFIKELNMIVGRRYEIGLAAFASYPDATDMYLEIQLGALFGRGWRVTFDSAENILSRHELWVS